VSRDLRPHLDLISGCEDDGAYLQLLSLRYLCIVDRIGLAGRCAEMTIAADAAREAALSLGDGMQAALDLANGG
jgi:hypothetical protein